MEYTQQMNAAAALLLSYVNGDASPEIVNVIVATDLAGDFDVQ